MKFIKNITDFLFGKSPDIFDAKGNVSHNLPVKTWKAWDRRYHDEEHNWRHHKGFIWKPEGNTKKGKHD